MNMERHANLFQALTEFYTLFVQLAVIPPSILRIPDPVFGDSTFHTDDALGAGYFQEAVDLMARLPYMNLAGRDHTEEERDFLVDSRLEIMPATFTALFAGEDCDKGHFESYRAMDDDPCNGDNLMPPTHIRLSTQEVYGITFIYDVETCRMKEWHSFDQDPEVSGYDHIPLQLPTEVLGPWIQKYRKLEVLFYLGTEVFYPDEDPCPREEVPAERLGMWDAEHAVRLAQRKLRDFLLECGWDVNSVTQDSFDIGRYIKLRRHHVDEVISPRRAELEREDTDTRV